MADKHEYTIARLSLKYAGHRDGDADCPAHIPRSPAVISVTLQAAPLDLQWRREAGTQAAVLGHDLFNPRRSLLERPQSPSLP